jgi:hypothetical protein
MKRFTFGPADFLYKPEAERIKDRAHALLVECALRRAAGKESAGKPQLIRKKRPQPRNVVNPWAATELKNLMTRGVSVETLAHDANVSPPTIHRIRDVMPVWPFKMQCVAEMLARKLGTPIDQIQRHTKHANSRKLS